jgi:DNA-binding response OmpR family regulator
MKILIAEDDMVSRRLLRGHLEKWGHEVVEARDGAEAWALFTKELGAAGASDEGARGFPIVVVDWMMPEVDGLEFIKRVRGRQLPTYTYLLMLTAKTEKSDVVAGMDAGADDYLTKPFDKEELRARLQAGQRILDLQAALLRTERSASVGRLATGIASEAATPIAEALAQLIELRQDSVSLLNHMDAPDLSDLPLDPDAPPRPKAQPLDMDRLRETLGPRFLSAEQKLHRVRDLVRNLRDFSRLDELPTRALQLPTLVTETLSMMRQELSGKHLSVQWEERHDVPMVSGNAGKLKRALYNLLAVLTDAAPQGSVLKLVLQKERGTLALEVAGPTPNLTVEQLPHLFEPFAQPELPSGLGLAIAFSIVREHGGHLEAGVAGGGGTKFTLRLPAAG